MADYIDREELLNKITRQPIHYIGGVKGYLEIKNIVNAMPSVDAVAVVRCKDCKKRNSLKYCKRHDFFISDDYYCASGVKKNE